jgi:hypothetical protein
VEIVRDAFVLRIVYVMVDSETHEIIQWIQLMGISVQLDYAEATRQPPDCAGVPRIENYPNAHKLHAPSDPYYLSLI